MFFRLSARKVLGRDVLSLSCKTFYMETISFGVHFYDADILSFDYMDRLETVYKIVFISFCDKGTSKKKGFQLF